MKRDMEMFESFFENFPIPVTMWTISRDRTVVSQRGNGMACEDASTMDDLFKCPVVKKISLEAHERAFAGDPAQYFAAADDKIFYVSLVPTIDNEQVTHVSGIAWDITSNAIMLAHIETIEEITRDRRGFHKEVHGLAKKALNASRLRGLMASELRNA
tara:strand:- start:357 stop:830 length:474 start_codon:yes stop_codon:yes gene_type:complete